MFTDTDEPLTFVAHGDHKVMRVWRDQMSGNTCWVVELLTPAGLSTFTLKHDEALDLAAMFGAVMTGDQDPKTAST